ncbi:MAG: type II toxin-antitoxin system PemK/MazF family toxin [Planctomycetes bacterium]|nr:type II toxin-antitoxin system PemK/MazF family toxin [Planctomycetota bacterium]
MNPAPPSLKQGSIVWAGIPDRSGTLKTRPLVIITADSEILLDSPIVGVAVSTLIPESVPGSYVELPWYRGGHPATGLARRCAAVCDWLVILRPSEIREIRGYVPTKYLLEILEKVGQIHKKSADNGSK